MPRWKLHAISRADCGFHLGFGIVVLTSKALKRSVLPTLSLPGSLKLVTEEPSATSQHHVLYSTVHRFKGLERRVVIVAEVDAELLQDAAEKAALCYVAFSRPRTHLVVLGTADALPHLIPMPI